MIRRAALDTLVERTVVGAPDLSLEMFLFGRLEGWGTHPTSLMDQRSYDAGHILRCEHKGVLDIYNSTDSLAESD
jgi:hypothetical protein